VKRGLTMGVTRNLMVAQRATGRAMLGVLVRDTYISFTLEGVAEASQIFLRDGPRFTKIIWKENSRSDGHCQCEKEMKDHLVACQKIFEIEPLIDTLW
jgi:hypothetical protein